MIWPLRGWKGEFVLQRGRLAEFVLQYNRVYCDQGSSSLSRHTAALAGMHQPEQAYNDLSRHAAS